MAFRLALILTCALWPGLTLHAASGQSAADVEALRALHAKGIRAHQTNDIDLLLQDQAEDFVLVSRGEVSRPTLAERRAILGAYLTSSTFEEYRDLTEPAVTVSEDGTLGWVIATVRVRGSQRRPDGTMRPLDFTSAWIELYEKRDGRWVGVGNVSNFKD